jgi:hypothetical protein
MEIEAEHKQHHQTRGWGYKPKDDRWALVFIETLASFSQMIFFLLLLGVRSLSILFHIDRSPIKYILFLCIFCISLLINI